MIVIFSGTTEGRQLSHALAAEGIAAIVCVATAYGAAEQGEAPGLAVRTGRMEAGETVESYEDDEKLQGRLTERHVGKDGTMKLSIPKNGGVVLVGK